MDQIKIGKFISAKRKKQKLTQAMLAEKLLLTEQAVSKWERGLSMPDSSIMLELCNILNISVNELLSGEEIIMENNKEKLDKNLIELRKEIEEKNRQLLRLAVILGVISTTVFIASFMYITLFNLSKPTSITISIIASIIFSIGISNCLKIEQVVGFYECSKCNHKFIPSYNSMLYALHFGRTRYLKCPHCQKKSWMKKTLSKD